MRKIYIILLYVSIFCLLNTSCLSITRATSYSQKDTEYDDIVLKKIVLFVNINDIESRVKVEEYWANSLKESGVSAYTSSELIFLGNEFDADEFVQKANQKNIDGILIMDIGDTGESYTHIPGKEKTKGKITQDYFGNLYYEQKTERSGDYYISKPWCYSKVQLFHFNSGKVIWFDQIKARGNAYSDFSDLLIEISQKATSDILYSDLLYTEDRALTSEYNSDGSDDLKRTEISLACDTIIYFNSHTVEIIYDREINDIMTKKYLKKLKQIRTKDKEIILPQVIEKSYPDIKGHHFNKDITGKAIISLLIDKEGNLLKINVLSGLEKHYNHEIVDALLKWEFEPGSIEGRSSTLRKMIHFEFENGEFVQAK